MLDPRIYRAALIPILFALIVGAFSLSDRPRPIGTTLQPDAFSASRAQADLDAWARAYPARRAGDSGDAALGARLAATFRAMGSYQVSTPSFEAETADGKRRLTTVIARQVGQPGPGLVVVAHRDALGRGARAELSGTAAMLELARVARDGRLKRTVTFVSTSGGSAGLGGARDLAQRLNGSPGAVLVLGDLAGTTVRRPFVTGWSTGDGVGSLQLRRTVEAAVRKEAGTNPGGARATSQWARLAFPVTVGEQGPLVAGDLPAALMSVSGERPPPAGDPIVRGRLQAFGRAALRTLTALDNTPDARAGGSTHALVTMRKVMPLWAVRLLVAALLLAPMLVAVDGFARVRRRHEPVGPWLWWILAAAAPIALALAFAWFLGVTGLLPATPPEPVAAGRYRWGPPGRVALVAIALVALLGWIALRPALMRRAGARPGPFRGEGAGAALLVTWCALAGVLWLRNPYAAALLVPGAHTLLAVVGPRRAPAARPRHRPRGRRRRAVPARRPVDRGPARPLAGPLRLVLRAARGRRRRRAGGLGHLEPGAHLPGRGAAHGAAQPLERDAARDPADHRARPGQLRGARLARRHRVRAAAMRRALGTALVVVGLLVLADAAATLAWQEPLSALRAGRAQQHLAAQLHALELAAPRMWPIRPSWRSTRERSDARAATAKRWPSCASRASGCAPSSSAGPRPPTCARARACSPARRCPASTARRPSRGIAPPTARRSGTSTRCAAAMRSLSAFRTARSATRSKTVG